MGYKKLLAFVISGGTFSLNDVVVKVSNNVQGPIAVPVVRIKVPEGHDAGTILEHEHVGQKARQIEVVNEFEWIYVLLNHIVAALVDVLITRNLFIMRLFTISEASLVGVMMALLASHSMMGGVPPLTLPR